MNSDEIREQAIEAAAKAWLDGLHSAYGEEWDDAPQTVKAEARHDLTPLVDAVLAVAGPMLRTEALRDAADYTALSEGAEWSLDYRNAPGQSSPRLPYPRVETLAQEWKAEAARYWAYADGSALPEMHRAIAKTLKDNAEDLATALAVAATPSKEAT